MKMSGYKPRWLILTGLLVAALVALKVPAPGHAVSGSATGSPSVALAISPKQKAAILGAQSLLLTLDVTYAVYLPVILK